MKNPNVVISEFSSLIERHFGDFHINLRPCLLKLHQQSRLLMVLSASIPVGMLSPNDEQKKSKHLAASPQYLIHHSSST